MLCSIKDTQLQQIPQNKSKQQTKKQKQKDSARTDNQVVGEAETEAEEKEDWGSVHDSTRQVRNLHQPTQVSRVLGVRN